MTPDRWKRLEEIYHAARTRDSAERAAYVAAACGDDEDLRLQIESLLIHGEALSKLESKVVRGAAPAPLTAGAMIGPYPSWGERDAGGSECRHPGGRSGTRRRSRTHVPHRAGVSEAR